MKNWTRRYLRLNYQDESLCWRRGYGERFEIVAELDEFYFLWAHGTMIAFPKYGKYAYDIETEIVIPNKEGGEVPWEGSIKESLL